MRERHREKHTYLMSSACLNPEKKIWSLVLLNRVSCKCLKHLQSQLMASAPLSLTVYAYYRFAQALLAASSTIV